MRRKITEDIWKQVEVAIAAGIGPREVARNMGLPAGTVLSHVKRKALSQQIQTAKAVASSKSLELVNPVTAVAATMQQRGERYQQRMAGISEKGLSYLESLEPEGVLAEAREIELHDRWSRRNYGLDDQPTSGGPINIAFLANPSAVQIVAKPASDPKELKDAQSS